MQNAELNKPDFDKACHRVAVKHGLGTTLVTGHKAAYFKEAHEIVITEASFEYSEEIEKLKKQLTDLKAELEKTSKSESAWALAHQDLAKQYDELKAEVERLNNTIHDLSNKLNKHGL